MKSIDIECIKGVIFIRIGKKNNASSYNLLYKKIYDIIKDNGIKSVVINLNNVDIIDDKGMELLNYNYELCKSLDGNILLCNVNKSIKNKILNLALPFTNNEYTALNILKI